MEKNKTLSPELQKSILDKFESRANTQGYKKNGVNMSKQRKDAQREFLIGAISAIDSLCGNTDATCLPPSWMVDMFRGDYVKS